MDGCHLIRVVALLAFVASISHAKIDEDLTTNAVSSYDGATPTPIVIWHGMGDNCCAPWSMGYIKNFMEKHIPGVYVHSLEIGSSVVQDTENGFFKDVNEQIELVCEKIKNDSQLKRGYHAIGFSQGGQFLRGVAQRCPQGMINLVTVGGQHQGVYGLPSCLGENHVVCDYVRRLLNYGAYVSWIQNFLVQAQYWHDPLDEETYRAKSKFIAEINNEREPRKRSYKDNLTRLNKFVMVKFEGDTVVDPKASEWFEFFAPGQAEVIQPLNETRLYQEDWIGLKELDRQGKLVFLSTPGNHLQIGEKFLLKEIIRPFLS